MKSWADWRIVDSPKNQTNEFVLFFAGAIRILKHCKMTELLRLDTMLILLLKVSKSQKQIMASWILPKNEHWGIFRYIKLPVFIFWKNSGHHIFFSRFSDLYRAVTFILFLLFIYFTLAILLLARCLRKSDSSHTT